MSNERPRIEYFFSFISLWSYIGSLTFEELIRRQAAVVEFKPVDLLAIFAAGGGKPVKERPPQRQSYRLVEMQRWRDIRGIPLVLHPKFYPADPSLGHRMLLAAQREGADVWTFAYLGLKAVWADELNIADENTLVGLANRAGLHGKRLLQEAADPSLIEAERALTEEAIARQVFGAPFYVYRGEPFWGQDRLDHLEATISGGREPISWPAS